ncbi:LacI family transcriptional regulator [Streptomyces sp. WAC 00631]|uniref:LacI family DNA-binding transcriptional regulator n=1 Tax=unclassified Streptomyces TaxID=2593676 RepID=UPI001E46CA4C|nr:MULTISPECIES: LacI family DNA-binding transcriptional regulator [unclassified Streptomyces]MCC5036391.1 LacI family transcriptional regulator [Streptomyces sp. WAC 00631]MCC9738603.1 LacI family transcriptional regulator [Streptomyces sp. MNU89]
MTESAGAQPLGRPGPSASPTLEQVARAAGVSRATASRAINGLPYVSEKAREQVAHAVEVLGYRANQVARSLATRRTGSIALVMSEPGNFVLSDPFFARVLRGIYSGLSGSQLQLVLLMTNEQDEDGFARYLCGGHVDGALVVSLHGEDPLPSLLVEAGLPVVLGGRPLVRVDAPYVDVDNFNGACLAARHLIDTGRTRVATIAGPADMAVGMDRLSGWRRGMAGTGFPTDAVAHGDFTVEGGAAAMRRLLESHPDLDAVFAASDLMAVGALQALQAAGRRIPEDVAVVGFDNLDIAATASPPLTTVRQPIEEFGRTMTWRLLAQLSGEAGLPPSILLQTELVRRESA